MAVLLVNHAIHARAAIPATGRGSGIPFDRQNSVFAGSAASIAGLPHRRPVVFGKSAKRRANRHAAPAESRAVRPGLKPKTCSYKKTQKQGSALTFGVLSKIGRSRKTVAIFEPAMPANCERPRRSFVQSGARRTVRRLYREARRRRGGRSRETAAALQRGPRQ